MPLAAPSSHYENFPVASVLCPPRLRPPIAAIYWFARTGDDLADEGDATAAQRLDDLRAYAADLAAVAAGRAPSPRWAPVFGPLAEAMARWRLPAPLLADLLDAFMQDVAFTRDGRRYADRAELADYCRRSANPVGRLLLHLYGVRDAEALARSDDICTALQLVNFWQDLSVDIPRGRHYLTTADLRAHRVDPADIAALRQTPQATQLIAACEEWARATMEEGSPLVHRVPGRMGWELRLVVQGGLRILDRIAACGHATLGHRPTVGARDLPLLLWRAARM
jgi:squalene synthase HpnC